MSHVTIAGAATVAASSSMYSTSTPVGSCRPPARPAPPTDRRCHLDRVRHVGARHRRGVRRGLGHHHVRVRHAPMQSVARARRVGQPSPQSPGRRPPEPHWPRSQGRALRHVRPHAPVDDTLSWPMPARPAPCLPSSHTTTDCPIPRVARMLAPTAAGPVGARRSHADAAAGRTDALPSAVDGPLLFIVDLVRDLLYPPPRPNPERRPSRLRCRRSRSRGDVRGVVVARVVVDVVRVCPGVVDQRVGVEPHQVARDRPSRAILIVPGLGRCQRAEVADRRIRRIARRARPCNPPRRPDRCPSPTAPPRQPAACRGSTTPSAVDGPSLVAVKRVRMSRPAVTWFGLASCMRRSHRPCPRPSWSTSGRRRR